MQTSYTAIVYQQMELQILVAHAYRLYMSALEDLVCVGQTLCQAGQGMMT